MATVQVPTMRAQINPNPRGSATAHVTMAAANPFEREVVSLRAANQGRPGMTRDMLPGMGDFWDDFSSAFSGDGGGDATSGDATSGEAAGGEATGGGSTSGSVWGSLAEKLITGIGIPMLQDELLPSQGSQQMTSQGSQQLPSSQSAPLPGTTMTPVPNAQVPPPPPPPQPGIAQYMPWVLGGVGLLAVGYVVLSKNKKPTRRKRRR